MKEVEGGREGDVGVCTCLDKSWNQLNTLGTSF